MFTINKNTTLTPDLLSKMLNRFSLEKVPQMQKWENYYNGKQRILEKTYTDSTKPCNRAVTNFVKNIVDSYNGYIASPGYISYSSTDDISEIMDVLKYNDYQDEDSAFLFDALKYGTAAELEFTDETGHTRFKLIDPKTCFGVYDDTLAADLLYFVRWYRKSEWDDSNIYCIDVYSNYDVTHYEMSGFLGNIVAAAEPEPHYFGQCPANIFYLPDEKSIFDCILGLQDLYNTILNSNVDDFEAFVDAYLALIGVDADKDDITKMKENRVLVLPEDAKAEWLTKNASEAPVKELLDRIQASIYKIAQCPDFASEAFVSGVSSGIALRFRLCGMETRAARIEAIMKKALQRRIEIICDLASLKTGESVWRDISIDFQRNIPTDSSDLVNTVNALRGIVSQKTLLSFIPNVDDVDEELAQIQAESKDSLYGNWNEQ